MAEGMNKIYLIGNLGADAELKQHGSKALLKFNLATTERWKTPGGDRKERTEWHRCTLWGERGEKLAPHLLKGTTLLVEGSVRYDTYEKDGHKKHSTEVRVRDVKFIGSGKPRHDGGFSEANARGDAGVDYDAVLQGRMGPPPLPGSASV